MNRILLLFGFFLSVLSTSFATTPTELACPTPEGLFATTRDSIAVLNWKSSGANNGYFVQWKLRRDSVWKAADVTTNMLLLKNLQPCSEYEFRVQSICTLGETSAFSESIKFKTIGCVAPCSTPLNITSEAGDARLLFKWTSTGATKYELQIREATSGDGGWRTETSQAATFSALNLKPCTKYQFRVRSICVNGTTVMNSEWSSTITVATTGCTAPCAAPKKLYYTLTNTVVVLRWDSLAGVKYELQLKGPNDSLWRTVTGLTKPVYETAGLAACTEYQARVRVICATGSASEWSYIVRFKTAGCVSVCLKPIDLRFFVADTVAVVTWVSPQPTVNKFVFQYKTDADVNWKSINVTGNYYLLSGLLRCKKYNVRVQAVCSATSSSDYSNTIAFETWGCQVDCVIPKQLAVKVIDTTNAVLTWSDVNARAYIIEYQNLNEPNIGWRFDTVFTNTKAVTNLPRCTKFAVRVRALCAGRMTEPSEIFYFATEGCAPAPCLKPIDLKYENVLDSIAVLAWTGNGAKYEIQYRMIGDSSWNSTTSPTAIIRIPLRPCKGYEWRVRSYCSPSTAPSDWSEVGKFETKGCNPNCPVPIDMKVDIVSDTVAVLYWTGSSGTYEIQYSTDGVNWASVKVGSPAYKLPLNRCKGYYWKVRRICGDNLFSDWSAIGKFETLGCVVNPTPCAVPTNPAVKIINDTIAVLTWGGATGAYEIQYSTDGVNWLSVKTQTLGYELKLNRCKGYAWRVRRICETLASEWTVIGKFETLGCGTNTGCQIPVLNVNLISDTTVEANWLASGVKFELQYRLTTISSATWESRTYANGVLNAKLPLRACQVYEFRIRVACDSATWSDWSNPVKVETKCPTLNTCPTPTGMALKIANDTIAVMSWVGTTGLYEIQVSNDAVNWTSIQTQTLGYELKLNRCKAYYWRVRKICSAAGTTTSTTSDWSSIGKFETAGCPVNTTCIAPTLKTALLNDSTMEVSWAGAGIKYELQYRVAGDSLAPWESRTFTSSVLSTKLVLPLCKIYAFRIRVACDSVRFSDWSAVMMAETRCAIINPCAVPTNMLADIASDTTAFLTWTGSIVKYDLQYRIKGTDAWKEIALNTAGYKLAGLNRCTSYEWRIRRYCTSATGAVTVSDWTAIQVFQTKGCVNPCVRPLNFKVTVDGTVAGVYWSDFFDKDTVIVQYKLATDSAYTPNYLIGTSPNGVIIRGLVACKKYNVRAIRICANGYRSDVVDTTVVAGGTCLNGDTDVVTSRSAASNTPLISSSSIYPNPGRDYLQIEYALENEANVDVQLVNLQGKVMRQIGAGTQEAGKYMQVLDNVSDMSTGLYFIVIRTDGKVATTQKWIKE